MLIILMHAVPGLIGIVAGTAALASVKGRALHRQSGLIFVYAMLVMSASGALFGAARGQPVNVVAGLLTFYLVLTALLTVKRPTALTRRLDVAALLLALTVVGLCIAFSFGGADLEGMESIAIVFGTVAGLSALGDVRRLRAGELRPTPRLVRHLWRMGLSMFIAVGSFFMGQADLFPEIVQDSGLLGLPLLAVVAVTLFWLVRVRFVRWLPRLG